jgi:hypothetical protein
MIKVLFITLMLASCVQDNPGPEEALQSFVEGRMGSVVTKEYILERVTGKMGQGLENISEEEFLKFSDLRNIQKDSFKILSKSCQEKKCFITYSIAFRTKGDDETRFKSEVKKIAEVVNENGKWLIADVTNIKTYHEAFEPITPLE